MTRMEKVFVFGVVVLFCLEIYTVVAFSPLRSAAAVYRQYDKETNQ